MTAAELDRIESELNLVVPRSYREFMQSGKFGEGFEGTMDLTGVAQEVIDMTRDLRTNGFYGSEWPLNFLVIGDDGAGDYYFMDVQQVNPTILFADHELTTNKKCLALEQKYKSLPEFWQFLERVNAAQERWEKKRWWKFLTRPFKVR